MLSLPMRRPSITVPGDCRVRPDTGRCAVGHVSYRPDAPSTPGAGLRRSGPAKPGSAGTSVDTLLPCIPGRYSPNRRGGVGVPCAGSASYRRRRSPSASGPWSWRWPAGRRRRSPTGLLRAPRRQRRTTAVRSGPRLAARRACHHRARGRGSYCRPRRPPAPAPSVCADLTRLRRMGFGDAGPRLQRLVTAAGAAARRA